MFPPGVMARPLAKPSTGTPLSLRQSHILLDSSVDFVYGLSNNICLTTFESLKSLNLFRHA